VVAAWADYDAAADSNGFQTEQERGGERLRPWNEAIVDPLLGDAQWRHFQERCRASVYARRPQRISNAFYMGYRMPDFLIAGARHAGTSALVDYLSRAFADKVFVQHRNDHLAYFANSTQYALGPQVYSHVHLRANDSTVVRPNRLLGERSAEYLSSAAFPARAVAHNPHVRIVVLLREPAARALSEFTRRSMFRGDQRSFAQAMAQEIQESLERRRAGFTALVDTRPQGWYVEHGLYYRQLAHLFKHVDRCQVHVMLAERLRDSDTRTSELNRLAWFLGFRPQRGWLDNAATDARRAALDDETSQALSELQRHYEPENNKLFALLGRPIAEWK